MEPIILASSSPRRQDILKMLNIPFRVIMPNIDESFTVGIDASETAELLAREKIIAVQRSLPSEQEIPWILSADTIVYQNGKIYGKPEDQDKAYEYLEPFSEVEIGNKCTIVGIVAKVQKKKDKNKKQF